MKIAYIGGGSRGWAWGFMGDLATEDEIEGIVYLYDIDYEAAKQNEILGNKMAQNEKSTGKWSYKAVEKIEEALTGADFVVISILPGTFDEMESDVHTPEKYGIYQSVGDTAGPGGIIRALRTLPMFEEIAHAIKKYAPQAWVINYTNPMTLCMEILYDVFPEIKAFGCCHEVFGTQEMLRDIVQMDRGLTGIKREEINVNVLGVNHFTWLDYASYKDIDLIPLYKKYVDEHFEEGYSAGEQNWMNSHFDSRNRVKFDLFRKYGYIAAAGDRHLAEFMPSEEYLKDKETVKQWMFGLTPISWRKEDLKHRQELSRAYNSGEKELEIKPSGEEGLLLIKALCGLNDMISNVNIHNRNKQIINVPADAVVETNALFTRDAIRPIASGEIPQVIYPLIETQLKNHKRVLRASKEKDIQLVIEAFKHDTLINGKLSDEQIEALVKEMIKNTLAYLPKKWAQQVL